jgi:hypothetical protein
MPLRRAPFVGASVTVVFLARRVPGTVEEVADGGRRVVVVTEDDEVIPFALIPATGNFMQEGKAVGGARLRWEHE